MDYPYTPLSSHCSLFLYSTFPHSQYSTVPLQNDLSLFPPPLYYRLFQYSTVCLPILHCINVHTERNRGKPDKRHATRARRLPELRPPLRAYCSLEFRVRHRENLESSLARHRALSARSMAPRKEHRTNEE